MEETQASNSTDSSSISRKRPFVCIECGKAYSSQRNLNKHTKVQHQQVCPKQAHGKNKCLKAVCGICDKRFTPTNIPRHLVYCHKQKIALTCAECGEKVAHGSLFTHLAEVHGAVKCLLCRKKFASRESYNAHINEAHCKLLSSDPTPLCPDSSKRRKLESGTAEDPNGIDMVCGICEQSFKQGRRLYHHLIQHSRGIRTDEWICGKCWGIVPDLEVVKHKQECKLKGSTVAIRHTQRMHTADQVQQCSENTVQTEKLNSSVSILPPTRPPSTPQPEYYSATCGICSKSMEPSKAAKHMHSQHNYASSSKCEQCSEKVLNCGLLCHLAAAHGRIECRRCTRKFASVRSFTLHFNTVHITRGGNNSNAPSAGTWGRNNTAKPHFPLVCGVCEQTFYNSCDLYIHILQHSRAIPRDGKVCFWCGLVISLTETLEHRRLHENAQCKMCEMVFASKAKLGTHIKQVHSNSV